MSSDTKRKKLSSGLLKQFWPTTSCERMPYSPNTRKRTHKHTRLLQFAVSPLLFYAKPVKMDRTHWGTCKWTHQAVWDVLKRPTFVHLGKGWWAFHPATPPIPKTFCPNGSFTVDYLLNSSRGGTNSESLWGKSLGPPPLFDFKAPVTQQPSAGVHTACGHFTWRISVLAYEYYN